MREATVSDLKKNFPKILRWIEGGERVEITRKGIPVAVIGPPTTVAPIEESAMKPETIETVAVAEQDRVAQFDQLLQNPMLTEEEVARLSGGVL